MRIGELAKRAGLTADTIRYYERVGLLARAPRRSNRYRDYDVETLIDLRFIKKAQALGLKLHDIWEIVELSNRGKPPCEHVRAIVEGHLVEVKTRIRELRSLQTTLEQTLQRFKEPAIPQPDCRCTVIDESP